jgi:hypothetical protein
MRKINSNAILAGLTPEQRQKLDTWLFIDNLSYDRVADLLFSEFQIRCGHTTVSNYFARHSPRLVAPNKLSTVYSIHGSTVTFHQPCQISLSDLAGILKEALLKEPQKQRLNSH